MLHMMRSQCYFVRPNYVSQAHFSENNLEGWSFCFTFFDKMQTEMKIEMNSGNF